MSAPTLTQAEYKRLKTRLTRKENRFIKARSMHGVARVSGHSVEECEAVWIAAAKDLRIECMCALDQFEDEGFPDDWHRWLRASEDASYVLQRLTR